MSRDIKYIGMDVHKEATVIAVLNGSGKLVQVQQFGQLVGIDTITFVSVFEQSIFSWIAHHQLAHMRLQSRRGLNLRYAKAVIE